MLTPNPRHPAFPARQRRPAGSEPATGASIQLRPEDSALILELQAADIRAGRYPRNRSTLFRQGLAALAQQERAAP